MSFLDKTSLFIDLVLFALFLNLHKIFFVYWQICLCKFISGGPQDSVTIQDISPGEGGVLENGDSAEVKYTGWLLSGNTLGEVSVETSIIPMFLES